MHGLLYRRHVGQREFGVDHLDVGQRIDAVGDMDDIAVFEAANDVGDRVRLADVGKELVAQAFALRGTGNQACDIDELDRGRNRLLGLHDRTERREARIGYLDDADVRLDRAERIVFRGDARLGQRVE